MWGTQTLRSAHGPTQMEFGASFPRDGEQAPPQGHADVPLSLGTARTDPLGSWMWGPCHRAILPLMESLHLSALRHVRFSQPKSSTSPEDPWSLEDMVPNRHRSIRSGTKGSRATKRSLCSGVGLDQGPILLLRDARPRETLRAYNT